MNGRAVQPPPLLLPRGLIFFAAIWLIVSFALAIGFRTPVQPSSTSYTPGVRLMLLSVTAGLMIGWPLLRLSQARAPFPMRQTVLDLIVLIAMLQVVLWPMRLVTTWSPMRTAAIDGVLAAWVAIAGAIVASAIGVERGWIRNLAMLWCVVVCLAGPALGWIGVLGGLQADWLIRANPFMAVHHLGGGGGSDPSIADWRWIIGLAASAFALWVAATAVASLRRARLN